MYFPNEKVIRKWLRSMEKYHNLKNYLFRGILLKKIVVFEISYILVALILPMLFKEKYLPFSLNTVFQMVVAVTVLFGIQGLAGGWYEWQLYQGITHRTLKEKNIRFFIGFILICDVFLLFNVLFIMFLLYKDQTDFAERTVIQIIVALIIGAFSGLSDWRNVKKTFN